MDVFWAQAAAPFFLFLMLLVAWPVKRFVQRRKDSWLKRLLLISWQAVHGGKGRQQPAQFLVVRAPAEKV